jgi:hypothetical protein
MQMYAILSGPYLGGTGRHMPGGVKSQGRQNILAKLILKMMYLMKKKSKTIKKIKWFNYVIICKLKKKGNCMIYYPVDCHEYIIMYTVCL